MASGAVAACYCEECNSGDLDIPGYRVGIVPVLNAVEDECRTELKTRRSVFPFRVCSWKKAEGVGSSMPLRFDAPLHGVWVLDLNGTFNEAIAKFGEAVRISLSAKRECIRVGFGGRCAWQIWGGLMLLEKTRPDRVSVGCFRPRGTPLQRCTS